ncbi:MAG: DUF5602 domain-containing protein [Armatimonadota bacterium]
MGNGIAYAWTREDAAGNPIAVGVTFTESALSGLPTEKPDTGFDGYEFPLALPKNGATAKTPFDHVALDWNPKGHIPPGIYDVPHFDVHFYMTPISERLKITLEGDDMERCRKQPDPKFMPEGYIYAPESEIKFMGAHWVDVAAPELNGKPFTYTFLYGSYNGNVMFYEPMMTAEYLRGKPNLTETLKPPKDVQRPGLHYPTKYTIRYDAERREYIVSLEGFVKR